MSDEAAGRLYILLAEFIKDERAAERRATVERIRAALANESPVPLAQALRNQATGPEWDDLFWRADLLAVLDAEAAR